MIIGVLQVELAIDGSESLKDKRRVVKSLKDRLHREHQVSVAEVANLEDAASAILGITLAGNDLRHCQSTLDRVMDKIQAGSGYECQGHQVEILTGQ